MNQLTPGFGDYIEPGYAPEPVHVPDEIYTRILDAIVLSCVDVVFEHDGRVLLGRRSWHPQADWWLIGGRMRPGEDAASTAARHARRDLGLDIAGNRFEYLTTFSAAWRTRRQEPAVNGIHSTSIVMTTSLSHAEADFDALNEEYTARWWLLPTAILDDATLHPALHQCAAALLTSTKRSKR